MLSEAEYERQIEIFAEHAGAQFLKVRLVHLRYLGGDGSAACALSYYLNHYVMKNGNKRDRQLLMEKDMFFPCPAKDMRRHTGMGEERQRGAIQKLESKGIIEIGHGRGNVLMIRIIPKKLKKILRWDEARNGEIQKPENPVSRNGKTPFLETVKPRIQKPENPVSKQGEIQGNPRFGVSDLQSVKKLSKETIEDRCRETGNDENGSNPGPIFSKNGDSSNTAKELASRFHKKLSEKRQITAPPAMKAWIKAFINLLQSRTKAQIERLMDIHVEQNLRNSVWPIACCGPTFCEKFPRIEAAELKLGRDKPRSKNGYASVGRVEEEKLSNGHIRMRIVEG